MIKKCVICNKEFESPPIGRKTCSVECNSKLRSRSHTGITFKRSEEANQRCREKGCHENLKLGRIAVTKSPKSGSFETNVNAKKWTIQSPDGEIFTFKNLSLFCKENAANFGLNPNLMCDGIRHIKLSHENKTKRPVTTYKGWQLLKYE